MLLLAQTSLIAYYGIRFHVYLFSQASICLAWWFQHDCVEERAHLGLAVGACPGAAVWSPRPLLPDSIVGLLRSSHNAVLVCVGESLALISSKLQSSWTYNGNQRMGKKILLQFPIGKHSLSSLDIQQWNTDGQRLGKVRQWILHALLPVVCNKVTLLQEATGLYPSKCLLWFGMETIINEVWRRA